MTYDQAILLASVEFIALVGVVYVMFIVAARNRRLVEKAKMQRDVIAQYADGGIDDGEVHVFDPRDRPSKALSTDQLDDWLDDHQGESPYAERNR